jgi:hypothetical protein
LALVSEPLGAFCASAAPVKGSSAAMGASAAARLIFTLVLLVLVVATGIPSGQESVETGGLCRQSMPGYALVTRKVIWL